LINNYKGQLIQITFLFIFKTSIEPVWMMKNEL
jgi:hypothetical protein